MNADGGTRETPKAAETGGVDPAPGGAPGGSGGPSDPSGTNAGTNPREALIIQFRAALAAAVAAGDMAGARVALDAIEKLGGGQ